MVDHLQLQRLAQEQHVALCQVKRVRQRLLEAQLDKFAIQAEERHAFASLLGSGPEAATQELRNWLDPDQDCLEAPATAANTGMSQSSVLHAQDGQQQDSREGEEGQEEEQDDQDNKDDMQDEGWQQCGVLFDDLMATHHNELHKEAADLQTIDPALLDNIPADTQMVDPALLDNIPANLQMIEPALLDNFASAAGNVSVTSASLNEANWSNSGVAGALSVTTAAHLPAAAELEFTLASLSSNYSTALPLPSTSYAILKRPWRQEHILDVLDALGKSNHGTCNGLTQQMISLTGQNCLWCNNPLDKMLKKSYNASKRREVYLTRHAVINHF